MKDQIVTLKCLPVLCVELALHNNSSILSRPSVLVLFVFLQLHRIWQFVTVAEINCLHPSWWCNNNFVWAIVTLGLSNPIDKETNVVSICKKKGGSSNYASLASIWILLNKTTSCLPLDAFPLLSLECFGKFGCSFCGVCLEPPTR